MKKALFTLLAILFIYGSLYASESNLAITVYNEDLGLVREIRPIEFKKGIYNFSFKDVPSRIDPTSVHFKPLKSQNSISILEQNYQYDLVNPDKIFDKYIDYTIAAVGKNGQLYEGKLLSHSSGSIVIQGKKGDLTVVRVAELTDFKFEKLPEGLLTKPTLVWRFDSRTSGSINCEVSYLTGGIQWHAEYIAVVADDDKSLELSGWVSIDNKSGGSFKNAKVKLIAGDVNIVQDVAKKGYGRGAVELHDASAPMFDEKSFFEYHLYTLQRNADILNNEIKQITLFPASLVSADKVYTFGGDSYNRRRGRDGEKVKVTLEFKNSKSGGLGIPLPKGKIRVYKMDTDKSLEFIGEDRIDHTPTDEMVRVYVGDAFDVVAERKQTDQKRITDRISERTIEIKLRNHKKENVEVVVIEKIWGRDWEIKESNYKYHKKDSNTIEFKVPVKANGGETVITYTARIG
ncbi:MAG: DUF4139 domain-containing protein [candidate division Zixibacteria bacterium]|nr:DUF4139 domain-containing protein [candidate division Zixibacteria bacterium]